MSTLRHGRCGAPDDPVGTELTSVFALRASTDGAQSTPLASMTSVDGAGSSAAGIDGEVAYSLFVELILTAGLARDNTVFACSVQRKSARESLQRSHHTD